MRHRLVVATLVLLALSAGPVPAQSAPAGTEAATPSAAPAPEPRPQPDPAEQAVPPPKPSPAPEADGQATDASPSEAPADPAAPDAAAPAAPPEPARPPVHETLAGSEGDFAACTAALTALGARFVVSPPLTDPSERDCGIARPVTVSEILPGVALEPEAALRCEAALALAEWTRDFVVPAARRLPGRGALTRIDHATAYLCRPRNGVPGETLSEHAFGNAIDIAGFRFERGDALVVTARAGDGSLEEAFQAAVRKAACLAFATVLGPGADAAHSDHLHLDVKARGGGYRLCQ